VQELQDQPEWPPGILDPPGGTVDDAEMAVKTVVALISRIMQKEGSEELADDIDRHTKLFLSYIDLLDKKMCTRSRQGQVGEEEDINKPIWLRNPNLVNLLSLANVMRKFGSLRDLWEGSAKGEGIIHWLKPLINGMHSIGNWAVCAMQKFNQLKAINIIVNELRNDEVFDPFGDENEMDDDEDENVLEFENGYCKYDTTQMAMEELTTSKPTMAVTIKSEYGAEEMYLVTDEDRKLVRIWHSTGQSENTSIGACFHGMEIMDTVSVEQGWEKNIIRECLLLPSIDADGKPKRGAELKHYIIASNWTQLNSNGMFGFICIQ
jgi:hypothetical protein